MRLFRRIAFIVLLLVANAFAQWSPLKRISYAGFGYSSNILAKGDTLNVVYESSNGRPILCYVRSIDAGGTWNNPITLNDTTQGNNVAFPKMVSCGNKIIVFWKHNFRSDSLIRDDIGYCLSTDGGENWTNQHYLLNPNVDYLGPFDVCSTDSVINVVYAHQSGSYPYHFKCIRSVNFGRTWNTPQEIFISQESGSILDMVSYGDRINVVWTGNFDGHSYWEVYHFRSTDGGLSWGANDTLTAPSDGIPSEFPKLSVDENGNLIIAWMDFKHSPNQFDGDIFIKQSMNGGVSWTPERQITFTHYVWEPEVVVHHDSIFVAWIDERFGTPPLMVYSIHSTNNGITWSPDERMEPEPYFCTDPALAYSNGHAYLVFEDLRCVPDTDRCGGAFFTKFPADPDRIIDSPDILPDEVSLSAYPNPFNARTTISYSLASPGRVRLSVYNLLGQRISILLNESQEVGSYKAIWDASFVPSGVYYARLESSSSSQCIKMTLLK